MGAAHIIDPVPPAERLFSSCLFCGCRFPPGPLFGRVPPGHQLGYDPARSRLWSICSRCRRWNLIPAEERFDAIEELERTVTGPAMLLAATDNIALYGWEEMRIVRIGTAPLVERTAWRYGRISRHALALTETERVAASAADAVERLSTIPGIRRMTRNLDTSRALDMVRWSRFGSVAWDGRAPCIHCGSILHALHFDVSWWLHPRVEDGRLVVGVPCTRCDPWTPEKVFDVTGEDAYTVLRRVLAYQHVGGSREEQVRSATKLLQRASSAEQLVRDLSTGRSSLWRLGMDRRLAFAIALDHLTESRQHQLRLAEYEAEWRFEEDIAGIIDDELS